MFRHILFRCWAVIQANFQLVATSVGKSRLQSQPHFLRGRTRIGIILAASGVTMKIGFSRWIPFCVFGLIVLLASLFGASFAHGQASTPDAAASPRRVKVAEEVASALLIKKAPIQYPDAARKAATQGTV